MDTKAHFIYDNNVVNVDDEITSAYRVRIGFPYHPPKHGVDMEIRSVVVPISRPIFQLHPLGRRDFRSRDLRFLGSEVVWEI